VVHLNRVCRDALTKGFSSSLLDASTRFLPALLLLIGFLPFCCGMLTCGACEATSTGFAKVGASTAMGSLADIGR